MRYFHCRPGTKFEGEHTIYDSREEFLSHNPGSQIVRWARCRIDELEEGCWIEADDGYIVQLLQKRVWVNKSGQHTHFIRVPMGTFMITVNKSGSIRFQKLYAQFTAKSLDSSSTYTGKRITKGKEIYAIKFALMIIAGISPVKAYKMIFNARTPTKHQIIQKVITYMTNEVVKKEIVNQLQSLSEDIRKELPGEVIGRHLKELLDSSEKGSEQHKKNIKFVLQVMNLLPPSEKAVRAEEVEYEEENVPPPNP